MSRALGLDLGSRTLGIAVSDLGRMIASPVETFRFPEGQTTKAKQKVKEIVQSQGITTIVVGLPKHMNGDIGERGKESIAFAQALRDMCGVEVVLEDERLTTLASQRILIAADVSRKKRKDVIDQMAAVQILQGYLNRK